MSEFEKFEVASEHSSEDIWAALNTALSQELNHTINSRKVLLHYENLASTGQIQQGTRLIYTPNSRALGLFLRPLERLAPKQGTAIVDSISSDKTRVDVIEPNQTAMGHMKYAVEEDKDGTGLMIVEGEFSIDGLAAEVAEKSWPSHLGPMREWAVLHGIRRPAERLVEQIPDILAVPAR